LSLSGAAVHCLAFDTGCGRQRLPSRYKIRSVIQERLARPSVHGCVTSKPTLPPMPISHFDGMRGAFGLLGAYPHRHLHHATDVIDTISRWPARRAEQIRMTPSQRFVVIVMALLAYSRSSSNLPMPSPCSWKIRGIRRMPRGMISHIEKRADCRRVPVVLVYAAVKEQPACILTCNCFS